jgi:hypothetical protein
MKSHIDIKKIYSVRHISVDIHTKVNGCFLNGFIYRNVSAITRLPNVESIPKVSMMGCITGFVP